MRRCNVKGKEKTRQEREEDGTHTTPTTLKNRNVSTHTYTHERIKREKSTNSCEVNRAIVAYYKQLL